MLCDLQVARAGRLPTGGPQFVALCAENCDRSRASDPSEKYPYGFHSGFRISGRTAASPAEIRRRALEPGRNYSILPRVRPYILTPEKLRSRTGG